MTWVKLDDGFPDHPKVLAAGPLAAWLYVCGLSYASRYLTDGFVPKAQVPRLADVKQADKLAQRLVEVGLWEPAEGGYQIHDYLHYQSAAVNVDRKREEARERMRRLRAREQEPNGSHDVRANNERTSREVRSTEYRVQRTELIRKGEGSGEPSRAEARPPAPARLAFPIPDNLEMTVDDVEHARTFGLSAEQASDEWGHFTSYYGARQGERRTDWHAQWRTWLSKMRQYPTKVAANGATAKTGKAAASGVVSRADGPKQREMMGR